MTSLGCQHIFVQAFLGAEKALSGDFLTTQQNGEGGYLGANPKYFNLDFIFK